MNYTDINAKIVDGWVQNGWEWGKPISHEVFEKARKGEWGVYLTPTKIVPHEWFGEMRGKKILGLASGGGEIQRHLQAQKHHQLLTQLHQQVQK